ncbi:MAG: M48 family metallopeptidase [Candidatus Gastranaerophilales bacterium]|nr:M48 family metallopeptidase [Candidatus Gastranaerophilales bacterium]
MVISKKLFAMSIVIGLFITTSATADTKYKVTPLELNTQIYNTQTQTTTTIPKNVQYSNQKDLQLDASIQKTQRGSLYYNQSQQELQEMVSYIGQNILRANNIRSSVSFKYVDKDTVNANTNSANVVTVYKGLIKQCESEDELAYVIGHEIGHATSSHVFKGALAKTGSSYARSLAKTAITTATGSKWAAWGVDTAAQVATNLGEKKYSRIHEDDADLLSLDYLVNAGYNPLAAVAILNKIGANYVDILSDHPSTDKRIVQAYTYIKQKYPKFVEEGYDSASYDEAIRLYVQPKMNNNVVQRRY